MPAIKKFCFVSLLLFLFSAAPYAQKNYKNFKVSVYARSYEVARMGDPSYIEPIWDELSRQVKVDKIYLETHRDLVMVPQQTLDSAKAFFKARGVEVAGGITYTINEANQFQTFCYSTPADRKKVQEIAEYTAKNFDEFILDDFFFTSCKCDNCIKAKGTKSWTDYRLELMADAAKNLVIGPAKKVNPKVKIVIKYPNWYEHFQGLGFNLEKEPAMFDGIYTGTETRDPTGNQHLQQYLGYNIVRYYENLKPGKDGGGWVDPGGSNNNLDRYAEQFWITLFAKAREVTMFDLRQLQLPVREAARTKWQGQQTSFDFDEMMQPVNLSGKTPAKPTTIARTAGITFEKVDAFLGKLGNPVGIKSYKPYHSNGEDFLQNYLGMIGLPMNMVPEFPYEDSLVLLTELAKYDPKIIDKIKGQLTQGKTVVITSGLLKALQGKGIDDIVELRYTDRKALVKDFSGNAHSEKAILIPQIMYYTNDSWEVVSALDGTNGWPILHQAKYSTGTLYVLTIPENFSDLYQLPADVLNRIRSVLSGQLKVSIEGPGNVSLYLYDNNSMIIESFLPETVNVNVLVPKPYTTLTDLLTDEQMRVSTTTTTQAQPRSNRRGPERSSFAVSIKPHSYRVFKF